MSIKFCEELLELLACPISKQPLVYDSHHQRLISPSQGIYYPIVDGIAVLLVDEARPLSHPQQDFFPNQMDKDYKGHDDGGLDH